MVCPSLARAGAVNVCFGEDICCTTTNQGVSRAAHATGSGTKTIGTDPTRLQTRPMSEGLRGAADALQMAVKREVALRDGWCGVVVDGPSNAVSMRAHISARGDQKDSTHCMLMTEFCRDGGHIGHSLGGERQFIDESPRDWPWPHTPCRLWGDPPDDIHTETTLAPIAATKESAHDIRHNDRQPLDMLAGKSLVPKELINHLQIRVDCPCQPTTGGLWLDEFDLAPLAHSSLDECQDGPFIGAMAGTTHECIIDIVCHGHWRRGAEAQTGLDL